MESEQLISFVLEIRTAHNVLVPRHIGRLVHASFLHLFEQLDPSLAAHIHDEAAYRPFTLSLPQPLTYQGNAIHFRSNHPYWIRVTLFDGGYMWHLLKIHFLESGPINIRIGKAFFRIHRMLSNPQTDSTGWIGMATWEALITLPPQQLVTLRFSSPTAFSLGQRIFDLFPQPLLVWESALRDWNKYAPNSLKMEKEQIRTFTQQYIRICSSFLSTETQNFLGYVQKGFVGTCTYALEEHKTSSLLTTLARFAFYAGIGSKTTMGMGQTRIELSPNPMAYGTHYERR